MKLYKILVDGKSAHGGNLKWDLPKNGKPGKWHHVKGDLDICNTGLHLTSKPFNWYKWGCECYEAEAKGIKEWQGDKCVAQSVRLVKKFNHPRWWKDAEVYVKGLEKVKWFQPDRKPLKSWKVFYGDDWGAAWGAAWDAARGAARGAADECVYETVCKDLKIAAKHRKHIKARMQVWRKGYALLCDVDGVLYVYAPKEFKPKKTKK